MDCFDKLKQDILQNYPRLKPGDTFKFACHPGISCFNRCCADVNILLTPYDVLRMRTRLGLGSQEFLDRYTILPFGPQQKLPIPILKMNDDADKKCPFVDLETGCTIYSDRPWPCRMYPVGLASPDDTPGQEEFYFLLKEDDCQGFECDKEWTIQEWMDDQGVEEYDEMGKLWGEITLHPKIQLGEIVEPKQLDMCFMASYDLDKFRRFLFETKFFEKFEIEADLTEKLKEDDLELLKFGFRWLRFCLLGEKTLKVDEEVAKARLAEFS
ncbi:MAG: YkgJ family cysteine cluster protein [Planctomycetes bacterium]|nr:YkgJ family cysteine cluster protein [Planctomycetota bacterium]